MTKRIFYIVLITVLLSGCISLRVRDDIDYPEHTFERIAQKIEAIHAKDPQRKGKIHKLNLMIYDGEDREYVKMSIRKWLANLIFKKAIPIHECEDDDVANNILKDIRNLKQIGPGLLIELKDKRENTHLLMWID